MTHGLWKEMELDIIIWIKMAFLYFSLKTALNSLRKLKINNLAEVNTYGNLRPFSTKMTSSAGPHVTGSYCTQQPPKLNVTSLNKILFTGWGFLPWKELSIPESTPLFCVFLWFFFSLFLHVVPHQNHLHKSLHPKHGNWRRKKELCDCLFSLLKIMLWILQEFIFPLDMFLYQSSCFIAYRCL